MSAARFAVLAHLAPRLAVLGICVSACASLPPGRPGPEADALARRMETAVRAEAWALTGAVRWTFAGKRQHLWDRRRGLAEVRWGDKRALVDLVARRGLAWTVADGLERPLSGDDAHAAVDEAWAAWVNDSFWLNPVTKAFDPGVQRDAVQGADGPELMVRYGAGGRTPGDVYVWRFGADGTPSAWRMWTSNIPIGGLEASWEGWIELSTGARVSTRHALPGRTLELTEIAGAATLSALVPDRDPFGPLGGCGDVDCARF